MKKFFKFVLGCCLVAAPSLVSGASVATLLGTNSDTSYTGSSTFTLVDQFNVPASLVVNGLTATYSTILNSNITSNSISLVSTGTAVLLSVVPNGLVSGGYQNRQGAVTLGNDVATRPFSTLLVIVDSTTDAQQGGGLIEVWSDSPSHNDPKLWFHVAGHDSSPEIRDDAGAPNWEMINTSTDNAHGYGKWEPAAIGFQAVDLQVNSRAYDNSTFENVALWHALSGNGDGRRPGLYLNHQSLTNDSGVLTSTTTATVTFETLDGHEVGLTGPLEVPSGSWQLALPPESTAQGAMMYGGANDRSSARTMHWTAVGTQGQTMMSNGTSAPAFTTMPISKTKAQLGALIPDFTGEVFYCSDCSTDGVVVSTGATVGSYGRISARTTAIN